MKQVFIQTIGCQMNVCDTDRMIALLAPLGYTGAAAPEEADLVIVNTCTIREKAAHKAYSFLGRLAGRKKRKPDLLIAMGGCLAQQEGKKAFRRAPYLDLVFGTRALDRLPDHIDALSRERTRIVDIGMGGQGTAGAPPPLDAVPASGGVSRFVTIMRGCENFCTYCVVPHVRGKEESRRPGDVLAEVRNLVAAGAREITLLGQNVNSYGIKENFPSFARLLEQVASVEGLDRVRFTTSHPKDLSPALMRAFRDIPEICPHIHLPVQSGSNAVLKRMNRGYSRECYLEKIRSLREIHPGITLTTDIIVGFPGETGADFAKTLDLVRTAGYAGLFAFKYSDRELAPAARFSGKVPEAEKDARLAELFRLQESITIRRHERMRGRRVEVLVDGCGRGRKDPLTGAAIPQYAGRTGGNLIVNFSDPATDWTGRLVTVEITGVHAHSLSGSRPEAV
ncbi:MAG: tRNA (N6-isopentenyl adenosine(37)-C2)-methylthiotransferase MiaB [Desulfobacterales bacterium]|nr:MAG: tRNA (N6-isopentenyl adenosine(37)-C2)-methylthiotransferase MiaB [Desulfobacterales bacterium]